MSGPGFEPNWLEILMLSFLFESKIEVSEPPPMFISGILRRFPCPKSYILFLSFSSDKASACSMELNSTRQVNTVAYDSTAARTVCTYVTT